MVQDSSLAALMARINAAETASASEKLISDRKVALLSERMDAAEAATEKLNSAIYRPLSLRRLIDLARKKLRSQSGLVDDAEDDSKTRIPAYAWQFLNHIPSHRLSKAELHLIYLNRPGDVRRMGNDAAHDYTDEDQAVAVLSTLDKGKRASLRKIFAFVHGRTAESFRCESGASCVGCLLGIVFDTLHLKFTFIPH